MEPLQKIPSIDTTVTITKRRSALRAKADRAKQYRCKTFIVVLENPANYQNIGTVIRNIDALGAGKLYIVDTKNIIPSDWESMRKSSGLMSTSSSAVKWTFVKRFGSTEECLAHLGKNGFVSLATSPHVKGHNNMNLETTDFTKYKKLAVWFGNETMGITDAAVQGCAGCIQIDMCGIIESLNLAVCTGIVINKIANQRRQWFEKRYIKNDKNNNKSNGVTQKMLHDKMDESP